MAGAIAKARLSGEVAPVISCAGIPHAAVSKTRFRVARLLQEYPLILQLLALYVFFLPLVSVQIPSIVAGFSINPARLFSSVCIGAAFASKCLVPQQRWLRDSNGQSNRVLLAWMGYLVASIVAYYILLPFGVSARFGELDSFFRSWRGRPIAQFLSLLTYGVLPYFIIRRYAVRLAHRRLVASALVAALVLLVIYGYLQQLSFHVGLPVSGRLLYEGAGVAQRIPAYNVGSFLMLRFYSLGGEPRDYGTFAVGALLFYLSTARVSAVGRRGFFLWAIIASILMTASTSTFLAIGLLGGIVLLDAMRQGFVRFATVAKLGSILLTVTALGLTSAGEVLTSRTVQYAQALNAMGEHTEEVAFLLRAQSSDLGIIFYIRNLPDLPLQYLIFGHGFGNYTSGMSDILLRYFAYDVIRDGDLEESRSFLIKMFVETGLMGTGLLIALFLRTLRNSTALIRVAPDHAARGREIALRYAYIAFFVAGMIQTSFYHFIIMALIDARRTILLQSGSYTSS